MRNLKVGPKIILGFSAVLVIVLFIIVISTYSTSIANINVQDIDSASTLQTQANYALNDFSLAVENASIIYTIISDEKYQETVVSINNSLEKIKEMKNYIAITPVLTEFLPQVDLFESNILEWKNYLDKLSQSNQKLASIKELANGNSVILMETFDSVIQKYIQKGESSENLTAAANLTVSINQSQRVISHMMDDFDNSNYEKAKVLLENLISSLEDAVINQNTEEQKTQMYQVINIAKEYYTQTNDYSNEVDINWNIISQAQALQDKTLNSINELSKQIDDVMIHKVDDTKKRGAFFSRIILISAVITLISVIFIAFYIKDSIKKPITLLSDVMHNLTQTGNFNLEASIVEKVDKYSSYKDEVGIATLAFKELLFMLNNNMKTLESVSNGDLTANIIQKTPEDTMGKSLNAMVDNLNVLFSEINDSTMQVSAGAKQLADGSQILAKGSVEQTIAIEQLSTSISDVSQRVANNTDKANMASSLATTIKSSAEIGSKKMEQMISAVKEINEASQSINKVIRVIDDIAFQTNILALNAAVEAARAGQHGKGFAVVAQEVRNLAAKSSSAAKDTASLIENSMDKALLGAKIAEETSTSLRDIVTGINESSVMINDIYYSSEIQMNEINKITNGVNTVVSVIQTNSATAQESAAASQEMSSQSVVLENLVSKFKLN